MAQPAEQTKPRLLLVDLSSIFWANWHASANQEVGEATQRTVNRITKLRNGYDHVAICTDHPPYKRKDIDPNYKAQRDKPSPVAVEQLRLVKERLTADGLLIWDAEGYEADDVIATATRYATEVDNLRVDIATGDKDLCQLLGTNVEIIRVQEPDPTKARLDVAGCVDKFGVLPARMGDLLALTGDKSDNVPGVPGIGPTRAARLLNGLGTLTDVLDAAAENDPRIPSKQLEALQEHAEAARKSRRLVALATDVPLDFAELYEERAPQPLANTIPEDDDDWGENMPDPSEIADTVPPPSAPVHDAEFVPASEPVNEKPEPPKVVNPAPQTAIVPAEFSPLALEPVNSSAAVKLANILHNSRLWAHSFNNADQILAVILAGRTLGLPAVQALNGYHIIEGRACPSTALLVGCIKSSRKCEYWQMIESTPERATFATKRLSNPEPTRLTYTIQEAEAAGYLRPPRPGKKPGPWHTDPKTMLRWRCQSALARIEYPDLTTGYTQEEMDFDD
jgi:5'-3' exonuclease